MIRTNSLAASIDAAVAAIEPTMIAWRRDLHEHPELGNRESRTAGIVAAHLRALGLELRTEVAHTGVVGVLRGALPGRRWRCAPTWTACRCRSASMCRSRPRCARSGTARRSA